MVKKYLQVNLLGNKMPAQAFTPPSKKNPKNTVNEGAAYANAMCHSESDKLFIFMK